MFDSKINGIMVLNGSWPKKKGTLFLSAKCFG